MINDVSLCHIGESDGSPLAWKLYPSYYFLKGPKRGRFTQLHHRNVNVRGVTWPHECNGIGPMLGYEARMENRLHPSPPSNRLERMEGNR